MEVLAPVRRIRARRELAAARRVADAELVASTLPSPRFAWRTNELCSAEHRRALAESLVAVARASEARYLPSASPLNRAAARDQLALILQIGAFLADTSQRVTPRGILLVERLLADPKSQLYARPATTDLHAALADALKALEGQK